MKNLLPITLFALMLLSSVSAFAQTTAPETVSREPLKLSGPRFGLTAAGGGQAQFLESRGINPVMSQFGWQFETRYYSTSSGYQALIEFIPLIAGLEANNTALSLNILAGFRTPNGFEIGVGPNFAVRGLWSTNPIGTTSMVFALGQSFKVDEINIPVNIAVSPSANGFSITGLVGFNIQNRSQTTP